MIFDKDEAVTLVVGEEPRKYELLVHACRISANSEFFETALKRRRFLVDLWVSWASSPDLDSLDDNFDQAFTSDLARALFQKVERVIATRSNDASWDMFKYLV